MKREGTVRDMRFEACNVTRAFGSASQISRAGRKVVFSPPVDRQGSYIQHIDIGDTMWLQEKDGIYLLDVGVAPEIKQARNKRSFVRRSNGPMGGEVKFVSPSMPIHNKNHQSSVKNNGGEGGDGEGPAEKGEETTEALRERIKELEGALVDQRGGGPGQSRTRSSGVEGADWSHCKRVA